MTEAISDQSPVRVLILDDDPDVTGVQQVVLEDMGCEVEVAHDFPAFRETLKNPCDLLVLDLMMPWTDGITVLRYLADNRFLAPILLSSSTDASLMESVQSLGDLQGLHVLGFLQKPFRPPEFVAMVERVLDKHRLLSESTSSIEEVTRLVTGDAFCMHYQPIFSVEFGRVESLEALVRAKQEGQRLVKPEAFMRTVETTTLLGRFTSRSIELVFADMSRWQKQGQRPKVAINIAGRALDDLGLPDLFQSLAKQYSVDLKRVQVEVTETTLARHFANALEVLSRLRLSGVHLAIDDFGVGYSTHDRLRGLPFTELKIDRSMVKQLGTKDDSTDELRKCIDLCDELELGCVAEGVESQQQLELLKQLRCEKAQGYYLSKPIPGEAVAEWLKSQRAEAR